MSNMTGSSLIEEVVLILGGNTEEMEALMACASLLRLDDTIAADVIGLATSKPESSQSLVHRIKALPFVRSRWDGTWYISEDLRVELVRGSGPRLPVSVQAQVHARAASYSQHLVSQALADGQITDYAVRELRFESAYQQCFSEEITAASDELIQLWKDTEGGAHAGVVAAAAYVAEDIRARRKMVPPTLRFMQAMDARGRGDRPKAHAIFRELWTLGKELKTRIPEEVFGIAAHLYGKGERNRTQAEVALRDSIAWNSNKFHRAQVRNSLGDLLAKDKKRLEEAERELRSSLEVQDDAIAWHSLGNLLAKDKFRWSEAETAFKNSLQRDDESMGRAETLLSLGNLLAKMEIWDRAVDAYEESLELNNSRWQQAQVHASWADLLMKRLPEPDLEGAKAHASEVLRLRRNDPRVAGNAHRILADVYEALGNKPQAIEHIRALLKANADLGKTNFQESLLQRIRRLEE